LNAVIVFIMPLRARKGVANNRCIVELLEKKLKCDITVPKNPQLVSAMGSALIAGEDRKEELKC